jgi:hypothetical protein
VALQVDPPAKLFGEALAILQHWHREIQKPEAGNVLPDQNVTKSHIPKRRKTTDGTTGTNAPANIAVISQHMNAEIQEVVVHLPENVHRVVVMVPVTNHLPQENLNPQVQEFPDQAHVDPLDHLRRQE